jgi:hypothetical protein
MRLPLAVSYGPRDAARTKDERMLNCYAEQGANGQTFAVKRPGLVETVSTNPGVAQGVFNYNFNTYSVTGSTLGITPAIPGDPIIGVLPGFFTTQYSGDSVPPQVVSWGGFLWCLDVVSKTVINVKKSSDGITWSTTATVNWNVSPMHPTLVVHGASLFAFVDVSPMAVGPSVYSTADGVTWTLKKANATSSAFAYIQYAATSFSGKLWILGGNDLSTGTDLSEVYSSPDGITWTDVGTATWAGRYLPVPVVFNSRLYIFGGASAGVTNTDSWYTVNGATWVEASSSAGWDDTLYFDYGTRAFVINSSINFVTGGDLGAGSSTYLYTSTDGAGFTQVSNALYPTAGGSFGTVYFGSQYLLFSGPELALREIHAGTSYTSLPGTPTGAFTFVSYPASVDANGFFFKTTTKAYFYKNNIVTQVTDADYPATTVPGNAYLDGTYYVMTPSGAIYGSALEDPSSWSALNVIQAGSMPDSGVALWRMVNYIVAFGTYTTEFFYDAGNATGSPLLPISNAIALVGCASAGSVAESENTLFFMGITKQKGRAIYRFNGTTPEKVSTPFVDRILLADDLATVWAYCVKLNGHLFYVLTLKTTGITLVLDATTGMWGEWTSLEAKTPLSIGVGDMTCSSGFVYVTKTLHGYSDGDPVDVAGAGVAGYNGRFNIQYIDANHFAYYVGATLTSPATGTITTTGYTQTYFKPVFYAGLGNDDLVQGELDGKVYALDPGAFTDNLPPIDCKIRTPKMDGGDIKKKHFHHSYLVGDKVAGTGLIRYSGDDYQTWSAYRGIDLNTDRARITRLGADRRRAFEVRYTGATELRLEALEIDVGGGVA